MDNLNLHLNGTIYAPPPSHLVMAEEFGAFS